MSYLVIAEIDGSVYDDETGVRYYFPAKYKKKILEGTKVVYYKGKVKDKKYSKRRLSDAPHYFGIAEIGTVYLNESDNKYYYADIINYKRFDKAVPFKIDDEYIENVVWRNHFRDGVRQINKSIYNRIVSLAYGNTKLQEESKSGIIKNNSLNIDKIKIVPAEDVLKKINIGVVKEDEVPYNVEYFYSNEAKKIGDRAELIVKEYLESIGMINVRYLAEENRKVGYDIRCTDKKGNYYFIEVKGTKLDSFNGFIMTKNEMRVAEQYKDEYYIYFVTNCCSNEPSISIVKNPYLKMKKTEWKREAIQYRISF